jgi:hypothetical protein
VGAIAHRPDATMMALDGIRRTIYLPFQKSNLNLEKKKRKQKGVV